VLLPLFYYYYNYLLMAIGRSADRQPVAAIAFCNLMLGFWLIATFIVWRTLEPCHTQQAFH